MGSFLYSFYEHLLGYSGTRQEGTMMYVAYSSPSKADMQKLLIGATVCVVVTFVFICVCLFTEQWTEVTLLGSVIASSGVYPWGCVSEGSCGLLFWDVADGWSIMFFIVMLLAWIFQFFAVIAATATLFLARHRRHCAYGFSGIQLLVSVLLFFILVTYGIEYDRYTDTELLNIAGFTSSLGASYWLLFVACVFSLVTVALIGTASKKIRHHDCNY
ncbi:unnamed protein product [Heligmosomoides polygyrus]|uniref:MARVEL domain-containing protein n=1 Tax=Heligmosomoides polygyrus TaxID=6339 RepID=A0A3P8ET52_HELPZ|nr:unnamed protein product [Heligmosomoides polygyrus]